MGAGRAPGLWGARLNPIPPPQILYARDVDQRSTTFEKSLLMGKEFQRRAKAMILRAAVLRNQIHVKVRAGAAPARTSGRVGTHTSPGLSSPVSTPVPSPRREPGGADAGQQPVPNEHQHVRAPAGLQDRLVPCPLPPTASTHRLPQLTCYLWRGLCTPWPLLFREPCRGIQARLLVFPHPCCALVRRAAAAQGPSRKERPAGLTRVTSWCVPPPPPRSTASQPPCCVIEGAGEFNVSPLKGSLRTFPWCHSFLLRVLPRPVSMRSGFGVRAPHPLHGPGGGEGAEASPRPLL